MLLHIDRVFCQLATFSAKMDMGSGGVEMQLGDRETAFWKRWHSADFSWEGLGAKRVADGSTLQDYWADEASRLVLAPDGRQYTRHHLPLATKDGIPTWKQTADANLRTELDEELNERVKRTIGSDKDVYLQGVVLLSKLRIPPGGSEFSPYSVFLDQAYLPGFEILSKHVGGFACNDAYFAGPVSLANVCFKEASALARATFAGELDLSSTRFEKEFHASDSHFYANVVAWSAVFNRIGSFYGASFGNSAIFEFAEFYQFAYFNAARFLSEVNFRGARFAGSSYFTDVTWPEKQEHFGSAFTGASLYGTVFVPSDDFFGFAAFNSADISREVILSDDVIFKGKAFKNAVTEACSLQKAKADWQAMRMEASKKKLPEVEDGIRGALAPFNLNRSRRRPTRELHREDYGRSDVEQSYSYQPSERDLQRRSPPSRFIEAVRDARLRELEGGVRALRRSAESVRDVAAAQSFFRMELLTRRRRRHRNAGLIRVFSTLYGVTSDFGGSLSRPLFWLFFGLLPLGAILAWVAASVIATITPEAAITPGNLGAFPIGDAFSFSGEVTFRPLSYWVDGANADNKIAQVLLVESGPWTRFFVKIFATIHSLCALALMFLFGLAARRQFQIG